LNKEIYKLVVKRQVHKISERFLHSRLFMLVFFYWRRKPIADDADQ